MVPAGTVAAMPGALPDGEPVPADGILPETARAGLGSRPFGIYVHVPFCATRCGYCDFNTYTAAELGGQPAPVSLGTYPDLAIAEIGFARKVLASAEEHRADVPVSTVFFGGGTPTLLPPAALGGILRAIDAEFGLKPGAEVTAEANPESVDEAALSELRAQGITRVSFGMQSAVPGVLAILDRVHQPGRPARCAAWARAAGFEHVSLDLIYGTPGESDADWRRSLDAAVAAEPDHVSAYALTVEPGTRLAARVRRGELPAPDDDVLADRYLVADEVLTAAGLRWYEISNWAAAAAVQVRPQHALLDRRRLVGDRAGSAQPRRRHPVVERQAPGGVRRADHRGEQPGPGPGGPDRIGAAAGARHAAYPPRRGMPARGPRPSRAEERRIGGRRGPGQPRCPRSRRGSCSPAAAACWPTP